MSTSTALRPAVRAAFNTLIDYAGLYPPAQLPMTDASSEYRREGAGPYAWMLGRFIVPHHGLQALPAELAGPLSVTVPHPSKDGDALRLISEARRSGVRVEALEMALPAWAGVQREPDELAAIAVARDEIDRVHGLGDVPVYLEIPRSPEWQATLGAVMEALQRARFGAKIRCGGLTADAFPSAADVAAFIVGAAQAGIPFKATAGLHHPVRHVDRATGFTMHGFLNLLAAAALALRVDGVVLEQIVGEEDAGAFAFDDDTFAWRGERVTLSEIERMRRGRFVAYGSCSFAEPVDDLIALGMLPPR